LRSHILAGARFGAYALSEGALADDLWPLLPDHSIAIVDRGFFSAGILIGIERGGVQRHWLTQREPSPRWSSRASNGLP
jgi:hypothetical protein